MIIRLTIESFGKKSKCDAKKDDEEEYEEERERERGERALKITEMKDIACIYFCDFSIDLA